MIKEKSLGDRVFNVINAVVMLFLVFVTLYPMYFVIVASLSNSVELLRNQGFLLYPKGFTFGAFAMAFSHPLIISGYKNIMIIMVVALTLNILMTLFAAYFLASKNLMFKKPVLFMMLFTMFFSGGMIPDYLNIRSLGLYDSLWALILPGVISVYNTIIYRTAIEAVPDSLGESAKIDGANDFTVLFRIIFPLVKPTTVVLLLYYGIGHWNSWFTASMYIRDNYKLPIQNILRAILIVNTGVLNSSVGVDDSLNQFSETIKYAAIVITTVPILFIYPFLQRYFVKGAMIGAVKG
ncbi:ABC transporter permease [Spirochaetia bacterium]|nr:ABC transporter permease [Spirochaetia bacterium]